MTDTFQKTLLILFSASLILLLLGCKSPAPLQTENVETLNHPTTSSTLWAINAAEYKAITISMYKTAASNLALATEDSYWTAYPEQENKSIRKLPTAIILDVDETVLNNAPYQARMIKQNSSYSSESWNSWVMEAKADAVPGALEFTQQAAKKGIAIFYLTNREAKVEEGTRNNLKALGFPLPENGDHILSKNERDNWTSAKTERRAFVGDEYRILMLFGDDLNDFVSAKGISQKKRYQLVDEHDEKWARKWYVLPNPVYGSWESALYDFDDSLSPSQIDSVKSERLETN